MTTQTCESCGMPMHEAADHAPGHPNSNYCRLCSNTDGTLQDFDERFERMVQWSMREQGLERPEAEKSTRTYMRSMPVWRDHPRLAEQA